MILSATTRGTLALILGIAILSVQQAILRQLSGAYPIYQTISLLGLAALPVHLAIVRWFDGRLLTIITPGWWKMLARGLLIFTAYAAHHIGLIFTPLTNVVAVYFTYPLFTAMAAVLFLRGRLSLRAALALMLGFCGLMLMVRPGAEVFVAPPLLPLLAAISYAISMVIARTFGQTESAAAMAFWANTCVVLCALVLSAIYASGSSTLVFVPVWLSFGHGNWIMPGATDLILISACGMILAAGTTLVTHAYRTAPASIIAPFEYTAMIWPVLWTSLFWGNIPDVPVMLVGIAVIIGASLLVIRNPQTEKAAPEGAA